MTTLNPNSGITRPGFFERGAGLLATGILTGVSEAKESLDSEKKVDVARTDPDTWKKEKHFALPEAADT